MLPKAPLDSASTYLLGTHVAAFECHTMAATSSSASSACRATLPMIATIMEAVGACLQGGIWRGHTPALPASNTRPVMALVGFPDFSREWRD